MRVSTKLVILLVLTAAAGASGLRSDLPVAEKTNEFLITKWTTEEGLPQNSVTSIIQSRDGYIWLTTFGGLARFDGISFTVFDSVKVPALTSNRLLSIFEDSRGTIWIGAETGEIYFLRNGRIEQFRTDTVKDRINVWGFTEDSAGRIFAASDAGLERFEVDDTGMPVPEQAVLVSSKRAFALSRDGKKRVWVRADGVYSVVEGERLVPASEKGLKIPDWMSRVKFGPGNRVLAADNDRLGIADEGSFRELMKLDPSVHLASTAVGIGGGAFWYQQADELYEIREGMMQRHDLSNYFERGSRQIFFDREGNIWIASTAEGLIKLSRRQITLLSDITDREFINVYSIVEDGSGTVWFANNTVYRLEGRDPVEIKGENNADLPLLRTLAFSPTGVLWAGGPNGLYFIDSGSFRKAGGTEELDVKALFFDRSGTLWIGSESGFGTYENGRYEDVSGRENISGTSAHFFAQSSDGAIWVGSREGAYRIAGGEVRRISTEDGLTADYVRGIYEDDTGAIWFATYGGGLSRLKNGEFSSITESNGLLNNSISRMLVDETGRVWFLTNFGVMAVEKDVLDAVAEGSDRYLAGAIFGTADGMPSSEANGGFQPAGMIASDGRLWFPMLEDVVIIDPDRIEKTAPKVKLEGAWTRTAGSPSQPLLIDFNTEEGFEISDQHRNIEITYTGLSYYKPESIRFFYKIDGLDDDWIDAGGRRSVFYPYLPPGSYTFKVRALGANGVWSDDTAELKISVPRRFSESPWLVLLIVAVLGLIGFLFYRYRVGQHERVRKVQTEFAKRLLSAYEGERRRMAGELHDGLGQNLLLIKNWASLARSTEEGKEEVSEYLEKITTAAADTLEETRAIVHDLGPGNLRRFGLTEAIINMIEQLEDASDVVFETRIDNIDGLFNEEAEIGFYRIVQECLNNVVKHSGGPRGEVEIVRSENAVSLRIADEGTGFDAEREAEKMDGIGLMGISQRVTFLGGKLKIDSAKGRGTVISVEIRIPNDSRNQDTDRG